MYMFITLSSSGDGNDQILFFSPSYGHFENAAGSNIKYPRMYYTQPETTRTKK